MKYIILFLLALNGLIANAQINNKFLERSYWQKNPTLEQVKEDIKLGNDPSELNNHMFDAMVWSILEKSPIEIPKYLLSLEGNSVNKITHDGRTYLMWAGYAGNLPLINYLIEQGSNVHTVDAHGYDLPTFTAVGGNKNPEIYKLYSNKGLDITKPNDNSQTVPMILAGKKSTINDLKNISTQFNLYAKDTNGNSLIHFAAQGGNVTLLKELNTLKFNLREINKNGENAVIYASKGQRRAPNSIGIFEFLKSENVPINCITNEGNTPLHYVALGNDNRDVIQFLLNNHVDPNFVNSKGNTALMNAFARGNAVAKDMLYPITNNLTQVNKSGHHLLSYALKRGDEKYTQKLLNQGLNTDIVNEDGQNLITIMFASIRKDTEFFDRFYPVLLANGLTVQPEVMNIAAQNKSELLIKKAQNLGISINQKNSNGLTPLHVAAMQSKNIQFINFLLEQGANKTKTTEFGETAYDLALENELLNAQDIQFLK